MSTTRGSLPPHQQCSLRNFNIKITNFGASLNENELCNPITTTLIHLLLLHNSEFAPTRIKILSLPIRRLGWVAIFAGTIAAQGRLPGAGLRLQGLLGGGGTWALARGASAELGHSLAASWPLRAPPRIIARYLGRRFPTQNLNT